MWFVGKLSRSNRGAGSIVGGVFILLILLTGYTFYFLNVNVTEDYNKILQDMGELDLKRNKENLEFISVSFNNDQLNITVKNTGSYNAQLIWLGIFDEGAANTQDYYKIDFGVNTAETVTNIGNDSISSFEDQERAIQLVTELGNTFSYSYSPSEEAYTYDFVDNNTCDVDSSADKGTHSFFSAQQAGPDGIVDTLTEEDTGEGYGGITTVLVTGSIPYQMDKDKEGTFGAIFWNPTDDVYQVTRVEFNASSAVNEVLKLGGQGAGVSYPTSGWVEDGGKKVVYWTGTVNVQPHTVQEFFVDIKGNKKNEEFTVNIRITANGTVYSEGYTSKQADANVPFSILWLGEGATPTFSASVAPSTETTIYVSLEEDCNKDGIDASGTLTIFVPSGFTSIEDIGGTGWDAASIAGNKIEVSNAGEIKDTYITYGFNVTAPGLEGLYMLDVSFSGTPDEHPIGNFTIHVTGGSPVNYESDLEVQWTGVDYNEENEWLCIYGGTMGSEDILVDVWNGTAWINVFTDLSNGWNSVDVSSYLVSLTFTIRFRSMGDAIEVDDWEIDAAFLYVWS